MSSEDGLSSKLYKESHDLMVNDQFEQSLESCNAKCKKELSSSSSGSSASKVEDKNVQSAPQPQAQPARAKHEWYQTESSVTVCILAKNLSSDDIKIDTQANTLKVISNNLEKHNIDFNFNLSHAISPKDTVVRFLSTKVEIKLKKAEAAHWLTLESTAQQLAIKKAAETTRPSYPTSSKNPKNWDKIVADVSAEEKDEKLEGDAALNKLFQQIYADGSEETRRAMNKSFIESGGTVLSTNWNDVGNKKVDVKAPDGMEWKKWDQ